MVNCSCIAATYQIGCMELPVRNGTDATTIWAMLHAVKSCWAISLARNSVFATRTPTTPEDRRSVCAGEAEIRPRSVQQHVIPVLQTIQRQNQSSVLGGERLHTAIQTVGE